VRVNSPRIAKSCLQRFGRLWPIGTYWAARAVGRNTTPGSLSRTKIMVLKSSDMKSAVRHCFLLLPLAAFLLPAQTPNKQDQGPLHGTVNVILANGHTLVAATDSRLTDAAGQHHPGTKLYKINDHTIATMAGLYEDSDSTKALAALIPQMMLEFSYHDLSSGRIPFYDTAFALFSEIKFKLDRHLHAMIADDPHFQAGNPNLTLELTIAGYDFDNSIKIAEITLAPGIKNGQIEYISRSRQLGSYTPPCAFTAGFDRLPEPYSNGRALSDNGPVMFTVKSTMFCEIAGLRDIPEKRLASPASYPDDRALQGYVRAQSEGRELTESELRALAVDLVDKTAADESRSGRNWVGGEVEVAVLSDGRMVEEPKPLQPTAEGSALSGNAIQFGSPVTCGSTRPPLGPDGFYFATQGPVGISEVKALSLSNCYQGLDGFLFLNSTFVDSHLSYLGKSPLLFPGTNVVTNSTLELGTDVDVHDPAVHNLICNFHWKSVSQGTKELKDECSKEGAQ